ncbi:MAG: hypothetical protein JKX76_02020 [Colwellia sp.]|nr:hypothetical protein [Colwellia sp.]
MANYIDHRLKVHDFLWRSQVECCYATFSPDVARPTKPDCNGVAGENCYQVYYEIQN